MNFTTLTRSLASWPHSRAQSLRMALAGVIMLASQSAFSQATVTTLANTYGTAGAGAASSTPVITTTAKFNNPAGIALDPSGTGLFLADNNNNAVRWISNLGKPSSSYTYSAYISTDGINHPIAIGVDINTNVYVLNRGSGNNGTILTFNGNLFETYGLKQPPATNAASLTNATSLALDPAANLYVTVNSNTVIKIAAGTNLKTTIGVITNKFTSLRGVTIMPSGKLALTDAGNNGIWIMDPANTTNLVNNSVKLTGFNGPGDTNGPAGYAAFNDPENIAAAGNSILVVADFNNNKVKEIDAAGTVTRLFGVSSKYWSGGTPGWKDGTVNPTESIDPVQVKQPYGLAIGFSGTVYDTEVGYALLRVATGTGLPPLPPPPPVAPTILSVTTNYGQVTLTWSAVTGATSYNVKRSPHSGGPYTTVANVTTNTYTDTGLSDGTTYYYVISALNGSTESQNSTEFAATVPYAPVPDPQIGYVTFPPTLFTSVFVPVTSAGATFNNDVPIVIIGAGGSQTFYTYANTASLTNFPDPTDSSGSAPVGYTNGISQSAINSFTVATILPFLSIKAIGEESGHPNSAVASAQFQFVTANPTIIGNNAAQFTISDITTNAHLYYTLDGSDPSTTNYASSGDLGTSLSNLWTVSFPIQSDTLFKVRAFRDNYQASAIVSNVFYLNNFVANTISFGFGNGEASSVFLGSAGQTFYAPITLTTLPGTVIYSLQFNLTVTNTSTAPAITPGAYGFQSMLLKPIVPIPTNYPPGFSLYTPIPPFMFIGNASSPPPPSSIINYNGQNFVDLETTNTAENLLGVGWVERYVETNLYNTLSQTLITYSQAHDDQFPNGQQPYGVIVGGYSFQVPNNALTGQQYQIQIGRPSATSDGIGTPGHDVYIVGPTNGATAGGFPINALKHVTVTNHIAYIAGSVYPFRWFNAGDFGSSNIVNADVEQVFESALYSLNTPPANSDFFDGMDSCGNYGVLDNDPSDVNNGYYTNTFANLNAGQLNPLFNGNDTSINQIAFGDGKLDVCDVYVTFRRSLDPSLTWFERFWNGGQRVADTNAPNIANHSVSITGKSSPAQPLTLGGSSVLPQVNFTAGDITNCSAGQVVTIPINATIYGSYPLRVLMLSLTVEPLDGSPALTTPVQFNQTATVLGAPYTTGSSGDGNFAAVWLNSTNTGLTGTVTLGTLSVTIPAGVSANSAYAIHFDHASASPNGLASFVSQTLTGLITLSSLTNSSYGDGIPDAWRLRWFGTLNNLLSVSNACPTGDGINNWMKYVAGVDPNAANDFPSTKAKTPAPAGSNMAIHWPSVSGIQYVVERSSFLFSGAWTAISTNTGTGTDMEFDDNSTGGSNFYRVRILP